ncbi:hypothetical protein QBC46DRAFT_373023 [Diplogelasinospora grovesii]|uniref:Uncharacterized protein n=1 Tax=Diplogelasinospora grovesii TaxID=303347 RepID=A0AAN6S9W3_9PEZI|nr:hypothetical protein QBC46DRAFT_373023 [Diplogelasinospora grovesii]
MGRLGPLTSQALGRSPYDDVVQGEGETDMRAPLQMYDERGRPVNPETRRINRDVIRSHNEVMLVIGVAEPDNGVNEAHALATRQHHQYEDYIGKRLLIVGRTIETACVWGVSGIRQRILLYKQFSRIPFHELISFQRSQQSISSYFFTGLPSFVICGVLKQAAFHSLKDISEWQKSFTVYIRIHLELYSFMQRVGLTEATSWVPHWKFFIPGSAVSPIYVPPFPTTSLSFSSVLSWLGATAVGAAPFVGFVLYGKIWVYATRQIWFKIYSKLPRPRNAKRAMREVPPPQPQPQTQTQPAPPPVNVPPSSDVPVGAAVEDQQLQTPTTPRAPNQDMPPLRRNSTVPEIPPQEPDFASDDEEPEDQISSATMISFDVEAVESSNNHHHHHRPSGVWSAELRPSVGDGGRAQMAVYRDTGLMRLPAIIACDALTISPSRILTGPLEAIVWLSLARNCAARGMPGAPPLSVLNELGWFAGFYWRNIIKLLGVEMVLWWLHGDLWGLWTMVADCFHITEEEWNRRHGIGVAEKQ